ncbi:tensin-4 [Ambystoma mexicanum]|uniref:tensin-4 n=1 Tax=Ambystoma mexicanum TaxID=8296 RepID=UPI0037E73585
MSRVIPNHVLHVGQSIRITSQDEHVGSLSRSPKCTYFTTERWVDQSLMGHPHGTGSTAPHGVIRPPSSPSPLFQETGKTPHIESHGPPYLTMETSRPSKQPIGDPQPRPNQNPGATSPTLDISIDHLNQLILELDPTFQPLSGKSNVSPAPSPGWANVSRSQGHDFPDVKDIGEQSARAWCEAANRCPVSTATPPNSTKSECILVSRGTTGGNCTANGSVIFSEGSRPNSHGGSTGWQSEHRHPSVNNSSAPCHPLADCATSMREKQAPQPLLFSLGHKGTSMPLNIPGNQDRSSSMSVTSNSPGSDTSYMHGSTHSLFSDSPDQLAGRYAESPFGTMGTFSNLNSPYVPSPTVQRNFFSDQTPGMQGLQHPHCPLKMTPCALLSKKGHANSCPPSLVGSTVDIPILLVNGCSEHSEGFVNSTRSNRSTLRRRGSTNCNSTSSTGSLNKTMSDSLLFSSDKPATNDQPTMKFVTDTSKYWFKPHLNRDQVVECLMGKEPGAFIIRDSTSYRGSFGLAMKVPFSPSAANSKSDEESSAHIRHFLIESSPKGVHLKGASNEPYFGSLSALVYQHAITPLSLPCKLAIPRKDFTEGDSSPETSPESAVLDLKRMAACNVLYLTSVCMETLTGSAAVQKAVSTTLKMEALPMPTIVHFKATDQGITLTDVQRKVFFRRHYPLGTISFCGLDPQNRQWQKQCRSSRIFGFVAKSQTDAKDNTCHLFAEYDIVQPVSPVIGLLGSLLQNA